MLALLIPGLLMGGSGSAVAPPAVVPAPTPAGGRRRKLTLYYVKVDGELFEFRTYEAAVAFLRKTQEAAQALAERKIAEAVEQQSKTPVEVPIPDFSMPAIVVSSRDLRPDVTEAKRQIAEVNKRAKRDAETALIFAIVRRQQEEDEDLFWLF